MSDRESSPIAEQTSDNEKTQGDNEEIPIMYYEDEDEDFSEAENQLDENPRKKEDDRSKDFVIDDKDETFVPPVSVNSAAEENTELNTQDNNVPGSYMYNLQHPKRAN
ncbi:phospholipase D C-like [Spea bombifrons]|uniref:phospholipase D C-like n=1 Tax=Spea bombifrons TaxID=233779 RepID=UPI00234B242F|nr:phospholipase D C-like [Spea bombifrons]